MMALYFFSFTESRVTILIVVTIENIKLCGRDNYFSLENRTKTYGREIPEKSIISYMNQMTSRIILLNF